jgi:hypothetical protein
MTEPLDPDGPPRGAIVAAIVVAVAAIVGLLAYVALRQGPTAKPAIPLATTSAPQADSEPCRALIATLPDTMGDFQRATIADPAPVGAAAWTGPAGIEPVILRCGVDRPADFVVGAPLQMVNAVSWFEAAGEGEGASTWYAVDHGTPATYVALTLPQGSGPTPIQTVSELIEKVMPARPLDPAPAR